MHIHRDLKQQILNDLNEGRKIERPSDVYLRVERLVELGADINGPNRYEETPLMIAAKRNNTDTVSLLVRLGANLESKDLSDRTPLFFAAIFNNDTNVINRLIQLGANVDEKDAFGKTAFEYLDNNKGKGSACEI